jgi:hypothetical protein
MNFDRLRFVAERAEVGEEREALFEVLSGFGEVGLRVLFGALSAERGGGRRGGAVLRERRAS